MAEYDNKVALGSSITQLVTLIKNALTGKQNTLTAGSGIDITNDVISSTGGGSSLPTDPSTDGAYKLVNTVETESGEQSATLSWEEDKEYTAGDGITIDNDIINNTTPDMLAYLISDPYNQQLVPISRVGIPQAMNKNQVLEQLEKYGMCNALDYLTRDILYQGGYSSCYTYGSYNSTTGTFSAGTNFTPSEGSTDSIGCKIAVVQYTAAGTKRLVGWNTGYESSYWVGRKILDVLLYKNNFTNISFSGNGTLPKMFGGIDAALTARIPDTLVSTETTPSTNNTINWLYE